MPRHGMALEESLPTDAIGRPHDRAGTSFDMCGIIQAPTASK